VSPYSQFDATVDRVPGLDGGDGPLDPAPKSFASARSTFCCTAAEPIFDGVFLDLIFLQPAYPLDASSWTEYTCKPETASFGDRMNSASVETWMAKCGLASEVES